MSTVESCECKEEDEKATLIDRDVNAMMPTAGRKCDDEC